MLPQKEFEDIYSKVPRLAVDLVIKYKGGIIFTKRNIIPYKGKWHLPGGTISLNERLNDAAKRITRKELGLNIKIKKVLGYIEYFVKNKKYPLHTTSVVLLAEFSNGEIILNEESSKIKISKKIPSNTIKEQKKLLKSVLKDIL